MTLEWDAGEYEALSEPHTRWGTNLLERVVLRGDETAVDAGCGTGRVTEILLERLPGGSVWAVDASEAMGYLSLDTGPRGSFRTSGERREAGRQARGPVRRRGQHSTNAGYRGASDG
ncbi:MAG: hypothetical protein LC740_02020 [Actinobacteria bacterium]|nr:hypothetical protein [Actinomycetota bacterium]